VDAFDSDVLIYAAARGHRLGQRVAALFEAEEVVRGGWAGVGSVLLFPELLIKPRRLGAVAEVVALSELLSRLVLLPVDQPTADRAVVIGAAYGLRSVDAIHLATAIGAGADRFITNNSDDFPRDITEIDVVYPGDL
jgi:predicted nucleic acid-binding protein